MSLGDLRALLLAVGRDWTLARCCEALGWEQDEYADRKFRELIALSLLLERFEPETLRQALEAYLLESRTRERARIVRMTPLAGRQRKKPETSWRKLWRWYWVVLGTIVLGLSISFCLLGPFLFGWMWAGSGTIHPRCCSASAWAFSARCSYGRPAVGSSARFPRCGTA
jgi:hypothetical protein